MDGRGIAWLSYIPIPGLALLVVALNPSQRLVRFHAWQGTILVVGTLMINLVVGLLALASDAKTYRIIVGLISGLILIAALVQMGIGVASAAMGRYVRLRPVWDLTSLIRRTSSDSERSR